MNDMIMVGWIQSSFFFSVLISLTGVLSTFSLVLLTLHKNLYLSFNSKIDLRKRVLYLLQEVEALCSELLLRVKQTDEQFKQDHGLLDKKEVSKHINKIKQQQEEINLWRLECRQTLQNYPIDYKQTLKELEPTTFTFRSCFYIPICLFILSLFMLLASVIKSYYLALYIVFPFLLLFSISFSYITYKAIRLNIKLKKDKQHKKLSARKLKRLSTHFVLHQLEIIDHKKVNHFIENLKDLIK